MMQDGHIILKWTRDWLEKNNFNGPLIAMGRSLGSASALELASRHQAVIDGLIIESGFAFAAPLLELLGISPTAVGFNEEESFGHIDKIRTFDKPTLIIHAEFDHIIPISDGKALYEASPFKNKTFLKIPGANHNDIFAKGLTEYLEAVQSFVQKLEY
jgi:pimeloyl-ACP methyl ester carboxylesterase